ncbi:hypothetical protein K1T71_003944 [Dendrolimus kikuchii]|uniref:Uncharacterized protein n=1 Tax=Dendrolimus kikuchii TaxID=765133 RepID=A0ACC1D9K7_9NEOP|nr:hypothetical protein K1T71_003944 [Dendrolimus kikuchii]
MPEHTPAPTPARSLYGFFMYLFSKTMLGMYLIWAFTPDEYLHSLNIYYYPLKYWSTAIPIQCLVALTIFAFLIYPSTNLMLTVDVDNVNTIWDACSQQTCVIKEESYATSHKCVCADGSSCKINNIINPKDYVQNTVPQLQDLDIRFVCKKLYLSSK